MSYYSNPFNSPQTSPRNNSSTYSNSSSPGFLAMTRPANASNQSFQNRSYGTTRPIHSPANESYSPHGMMRHHPRRFSPRGDYNYHTPNRNYHTPNRNYHTPNRNYHSNQRHSTPIRDQNTPRGCFRGNRSFDSQFSSPRYSPQNSSMQKTPLKEIPIEKFVSAAMLQNPWEEIENKDDVPHLVLPDEDVSFIEES